MLRALNNTRRLLSSVWKRSLTSERPADIEATPNENVPSDSQDIPVVDTTNRTAQTYSKDAIVRLKLDQYPFYVEREWWKRGNRMTFWATWRQLRDVKRREQVAEAGPDRMRLKALKWNTVLPQAIRDAAAEELHNMPKYTIPRLVLNMCMFTGRQRGKIKPYRLNRHLFRKLADHSKLSGVQRAMW